MSEMVKHCVAPACSNWPGPTRRSVISPADRREHRHLRRGRIFQQGFRVADAQHAQRIRARFHIRLRLRACRFGLLQIGFGDGLVLVEIFGALVLLVGKLKCVARF